VSPEDLVKCEEQYEKGKAVDSILTQVAKKRDMDAEKLYEMIAWPLSKTYGHAYEAFRLSISYVVCHLFPVWGNRGGRFGGGGTGDGMLQVGG
jgi:translation initiation factor 2 subunit 1